MRVGGPAIAVLLGLVGVAGCNHPSKAADDAQTTALSPPRGESTQRYLDAVAGRRLQVDIVYLPPGAPLDGTVQAPEEPLDTSPSVVPPLARGLSWGVLALFAAAALFFLVRHRHALAETFGGGNRRLARDKAEAVAPAREIDHDLLTRLRQETDPRTGLRLVLQRFLALAAQENQIVLRRSLTTRELLRALPDSWRHRGDLDALARRVELVVFGGRDIDRQGYEECLDLAAPLLFRTAAT